MCLEDTRLTTAERILKALEKQNTLTEELLQMVSKRCEQEQQPNLLGWDTNKYAVVANCIRTLNREVLGWSNSDNTGCAKISAPLLNALKAQGFTTATVGRSV